MVNATAIVESADITVAYINPPKEGKVWGNIKDTANNIYYGPPEKLAMFKPGETCKMEYTLSKDGKFKNIGHKVGIPAVLQKPVAPAPRAPTNPTDSLRMGTMGMVNAFIHSGQVPMQRDAIKSTIKMCMEAYNDEWGTPAMNESKHEFNDEIPGF